jgi:penicillin-binding protein 2
MVTGIRNPQTGETKHFDPVELPRVQGGTPEQWKVIMEGMRDTMIHGTARAIATSAEYQMAGKTGTAQVFTVAQNQSVQAAVTNERLRDHSWFVAFAPAENPQIAVAVLVENGGFGASAAAPIARSVMDAYLLPRLPRAEPASQARPSGEAGAPANPRRVPGPRPPPGSPP